MRHQNRTLLRALGFVMVLMGLTLLVGCSLAADVTPPPDAQSLVAPQATQAPASLPLVAPDPRQGEALYREKCAPCHGERGLGDGPQAAQLPVAVPALGDEALAREARPVDWFTMVTQGNVERFMPGFRSLSDRQRWDVVAYALSLSLSPDAVRRGGEIYAAQCQACHGPQGEGNGPQAASAGVAVANWRAEPGLLAQRSLRDLYSAVAEGHTSPMPSFAQTLSEEDIWAVAAYVRTLSFAAASPAQVAEGVQTPTAVQTPEVVSATATPQSPTSAATPSVVTGQVTNATLGRPLEDIEVRLQIFDASMQPVVERTTRTDAQGHFAFEDIEVTPGRTLLASVEYAGLSFNSDPYHMQASSSGQSIDLPITVYETTTDASVLRADRLHVFLDVPDSTRLQVVELLLFSNTGDRVLVGANPGEPVVRVKLPPSATNLQFEDGELGQRYVALDDGFGDTQPVYPGVGSQLLFAYEVPLSRKAQLAIPMPMPVDAAIVMAPQDVLQIQGADLQPMGTRDVQGITLQVFVAESIPAGAALEFSVSSRNTLPWRLNVTSQTGLMLGVGAFLVVLGVLGFWYWRRTRPRPETSAPTEPEDAVAILDAIIALDDLYRAGELSEEVYRARREELKARLRNLQSREG